MRLPKKFVKEDCYAVCHSKSLVDVAKEFYAIHLKKGTVIAPIYGGVIYTYFRVLGKDYKVENKYLDTNNINFIEEEL